jgi:hypothetical protein
MVSAWALMRPTLFIEALTEFIGVLEYWSIGY